MTTALKPLVINFFGSSGCGKSTAASFLFTKLKMERMNVELVTEFAKEMVWENNDNAFQNQAYLFGNQSYRMSRLKGKVDIIITDAPLPLSILHNKDKTLGIEFNSVVMNVFNSYNNLNFFMLRSQPFDPIGRLETEEESDALVPVLQHLLDNYQITYQTYHGTEENYEKIANKVITYAKECGIQGSPI